MPLAKFSKYHGWNNFAKEFIANIGEGFYIYIKFSYATRAALLALLFAGVIAGVWCN